MLMYDMFDGDDMNVAKMQHDVYDQALSLIIDGCRTHYTNACTLTGAQCRWPVDLAIDHRTLQDAHDILGGTWRWRVDPPEKLLPMQAAPQGDTSASSWLRWLKSEIESWAAVPNLVLSVVAIVTHQNSVIGYAGELRLRTSLLGRFDDVPWRNSMFGNTEGRGTDRVEMAAAGE